MDHWLLLPAIIATSAAAEWLAVRGLLRARPPSLLSRNYRGLAVVGRGGVTFTAPLAAGVALVVLARTAPRMDVQSALGAATAALLFGLLGWLDDARGTPGVRGLLGHLRRLILRRELTTGLVKAGGGAAVSLWVVYMSGVTGWPVLAGGALIALSANSMNALDARPGRAVKAFIPAAALLIAVGWWAPVPGPLAVVAALLGGALAFVGPDLGERVMLGDTGANPLGCVLGMAAVALTPWQSWVALSVLLLLFCLVADRWSLTRMVAASPVLRWLDGIGRPEARP